MFELFFLGKSDQESSSSSDNDESSPGGKAQRGKWIIAKTRSIESLSTVLSYIHFVIMNEVQSVSASSWTERMHFQCRQALIFVRFEVE
jgi:hypothetical protein